MSEDRKAREKLIEVLQGLIDDLRSWDETDETTTPVEALWALFVHKNYPDGTCGIVHWVIDPSEAEQIHLFESINSVVCDYLDKAYEEHETEQKRAEQEVPKA